MRLSKDNVRLLELLCHARGVWYCTLQDWTCVEASHSKVHQLIYAAVHAVKQEAPKKQLVQG